MRAPKQLTASLGLLALVGAQPALAQQPPAAPQAEAQAEIPPDIRPLTGEETARVNKLWRSISFYIANGGHANALEKELPELLALAGQTYGPNHPATLWTRLLQAGSLSATMQHEESERLFVLTIDQLKRRIGAEAPMVLSATIDRGANLITWGRPRDADVLLAPLAPAIEKRFGAESGDNARLLANLAFLRHAQGRFAEAETLARRALSIREAKLKPDDPLLGSTRARIAAALIGQGKYADADALLAAALPGEAPNNIGGARLLEARGDLRSAQGRSVDAEKDLVRAGQLFVEHAGYKSPEAQVASAKARLAAGITRDLPGGTALGSANALPELPGVKCSSAPRHLGEWWEMRVDAAFQFSAPDVIACHRAVLGFAERNLGPEHPDTAAALFALAAALHKNGQTEEAEPFIRRAVAARLASSGQAHPESARAFAFLGEVLGALGKTEEADALALRAGGAAGAAGAGVRQLIQQATLLEGTGRFQQAADLWSDVDAKIAAGEAAQDLPLMMDALAGFAFNRFMIGRCDELQHDQIAATAEQWKKLYSWDFQLQRRRQIEEALAISEACRGQWAAAARRYDEVVRAAGAGSELALFYSRARALAETRRALTLVRDRSQLEAATSAAQGAALIAEQRRYVMTVGGEKAGGALRLPAGTGDDPLAAAFVAQLKTQWARLQRDVGPTADLFTTPLSHEEQIALIRAGQQVPETPVAREGHLGGTAFLAAQNLGISAAAQSLLQAAARSSIRDPALAALVRREQELAGAIAEADRKLFGGFGTIDAAELRRIGASKAELERITQQIQASDPRYAELVRPGALDFGKVQQRLKPGEALLYIQPAWDDVYVFAVGKRRFLWHKLTVDAPALDEFVRQLRCGLDGAACQPGESAGAPFDFAVAHELYREIVKPVERALEGAQTLFVAASGSVGGLPLGVLVTEPPAAGDPMRTASWLADRYAMVSLPSVSSLRAFEAAGDRAYRAELTAYGNPVLGPPAEPSPNRAARKTGTRFADVAAIKAMPSLPGTERELLAMAGGLGVPRDMLRLGRDATEAAVKRDPLLGESRVVVFATHGVLPGGSGNFQEPGLVFTPPAAPSAEDDGLLTASEAAGLNLPADWLILSACNTAGADGRPGGEALSGLARAFLYAGARSLLASHWQVSDDATAALTVEALRIAKARPELGRAQAMQAAMRAVRTGRTMDGSPLAGWKPEWADPWFWAPFVLIEAGS